MAIRGRRRSREGVGRDAMTGSRCDISRVLIAFLERAVARWIGGEDCGVVNGGGSSMSGSRLGSIAAMSILEYGRRPRQWHWFSIARVGFRKASLTSMSEVMEAWMLSMFKSIVFLGEMLGVKANAQPFLDPNTTGTVILQGVSYASGGGGILNSTGRNFARFISASAACCGNGGQFAGIIPCGPTSSLCHDRTKHVFWDPYHSREAANLIIAKQLVDGDSKVYISSQA